ncbi:MAG TPA: EAL domain-containing protein [Phenylobacterium sp.]|nr:EAL domain-containing protein [Phenylobacterium sp.]
MRRLTLPLLTASYFSLALILALLLWRNGGGWGAGLAAMVGGLALCFTFHGLIGRALEVTALRREIEAIRQAQRILIDQMEAVDARVAQVLESVADDAQRRSEELTTEVHLLEDLVQRMSDKLEERMDAPPVHAAAPGRIDGGRHLRQSAALLETVREALAENRVDLYLQPVVGLPQRRTVFYESFSRLRDETGRVMMPAEYLTVAEPEGLVTAIDNLLLFRCVQIVRRLAKTDKKVGIFCNVSMASLADESFFPQFLEMLAANRDLAGALIFEVGQAAFDSRGAIEARNMGKLADLGFRFSIDKITDLDLDFQDLARSDVKFVKIGAQFLLDQLTETDEGLILKSVPDLAAEDFAALTRRYGVEIIAEKVEAERQIVDILELDIAYGQGHLFGEPRPIKDAVLAETTPPADFLRGSLRRRSALG